MEHLTGVDALNEKAPRLTFFFGETTAPILFRATLVQVLRVMPKLQLHAL